jgi:solute carrier family 25 (mitochondrial carnitine/acylcarnitine transporter), member 20/29
MSSSTSPGVTLNRAVAATLPPAVADKLPHVPESKDELKADAQVAAAKSFAGLRSFAAGGFGGICAVIVGHPFDLVKVRLQTAEKGVYSSAVDCLRKSVARDGLRRGLYAGVSAPLVGVTPMCEFLLPLLVLLWFLVLRGLRFSIGCVD